MIHSLNETVPQVTLASAPAPFKHYFKQCLKSPEPGTH